MNKQDPHLNDLMPADEQTEIFRAALMDHHFAIVAQITAHLDMVQATPGAMTMEVLAFIEKAIAAQVQWLASHGIYFPNPTESQVRDNG